MKSKGCILVVDDLEQWREQLVETLQDNGYYAESASTAKEVLQQLETTLYHLVILDIRLADNDPSNFDGLGLLAELEKRGLSEATKIIMLSSHDTKEHIRTAFRDYKVADFLSKDTFTERQFLESVRKVFSQEANINLELGVHWHLMDGPEQAVLNLEVAGVRVRRNSSLQSQIANELNDLLCRLFYEAESVLVRPLTAGHSATGVMWAQPFYAYGGGHAVVVKFGDFLKIDQEYSNFRRYVQPFIGGGRNTSILSTRRTPHLGGILYSLLGANSDYMEDFGIFYQHATIAQIQGVLDGLFLDTCSAWYANHGQLQPYNLTTDYQQLLEFTPEKIEHGLVEMQKYVQGGRKLHFKSLNSERSFTNPVLALGGPPFLCSTYVCPTHGDFNQHNILVDTTNHTWLIDFQATSPGHILRDVAQLDSEIRFVLLKPEDATLEERLIMEETLCGIERFSHIPKLLDHFVTENQKMTKAYSTVVHLRMLAYKLLAQRANDDISEYYIALFYNAVNTIRYYSLPFRQREHALLSASIIADRLELKG